MKRNYPILVALVVVLVGVSLGLGNQRIIAYTVKGDSASGSSTAGAADVTNSVALFDDTVVHSIQLIISEDDYQSMITTYQQTGDKQYFQADILIDGVRVNDVGVRLKGNASLRTAVGGKMRIAGNFGGQAQENFQPGDMPQGFDPGNLPEGFQPGNMPQDFDPNNLPEGFQPGNMPQGGGINPRDQGGRQNFQPGNLPGGAGQQDAGDLTEGAANGETKIPLQIKFDEYVDGQTYQGYTRLAIRTYGTSNDAAMLQEPLTNAAARLVGLPVTQTAYTGFRLNDGQETLYSISEVIDETYLAEHFSYAGGVLYKSEVGATMTYTGEDPTDYTSSFSQETRVNDADFAPLIDFIQFVNESDDATFESELPQRFDVDAFATYLALNNLLVNADSLVGMGNNYYLYYDDITGRFTLLMWDANESLGKLGMGNISTDYDIYYAGSSSNVPMMRGGSNVLFTRFMATPSFKALYEQKLIEIYQAAFASGALQAQAEQYAALVRPAVEARGLGSLDAYDQAVNNTLKFIQLRGEYLATTQLLGSQ